MYSFGVPGCKKGTIFLNILFSNYSSLIFVTFISSFILALQDPHELSDSSVI